MNSRAEQHLLAAHDARVRIERNVDNRFRDGEADEHVGEAMVRLAAAETTCDEDHARALLSRTANALAIDCRRHRRSAERHAPQLAPPATAESAEDAFLEVDLHDRARRALLGLPPVQREIVAAWAEGAAPREIAAAVGRSIDSVKSHLKRGLATMKDRLTDAELGLVAVASRMRHRVAGAELRVATLGIEAALAMPAIALALSVASGLSTPAMGATASPPPAAPHHVVEHPGPVGTGMPRARATARLATPTPPPLSMSAAGSSSTPESPVAEAAVAGQRARLYEPPPTDKPPIENNSRLAEGDVQGFIDEVESCVPGGETEIWPREIGCRELS